MTIVEAVEMVLEYMEANARKVAEQQSQDGLTPSYSAKHHHAAMGRALRKVLDGMPTVSAAELGLLCMKLSNHSAWRQRFEGKGIFPSAAKPDKPVSADKAAAKLAALLAEFEEE